MRKKKATIASSQTMPPMYTVVVLLLCDLDGPKNPDIWPDTCEGQRAQSSDFQPIFALNRAE